MLREILKQSIKSSIIAYDKIKVGLIQMKETLEDVTAEAKSEIFGAAEPTQYHAAKSSGATEEAGGQNDSIFVPKNENNPKEKDSLVC